jgi:outer membrane receptor protein involved in Fe transport
LAGTNSLTPAQIAYVKYQANRDATYGQDMVYANISGELFDLPAGAVGFAAGAEYRKETIEDTPDAIVSGGDSAEGDAKPTKGDYSVSEFYAETNIPLLKGVDFFKDLSVDAAVRFSDYSNFGETTNYKVGANWALSDDLRFRANYGTGFRAPQVGAELFLGPLQTFIDFVDPCDTSGGPVTNPTVAANCAAQINPILGGGASLTYLQDVPQLNAVLQGNKALQPEESKQFTVGAVLTPSFAENLVLTVDYYKTDITNVIVSGADPGVGQAILDSCYRTPGLASPLCAFLSPRDAIGAQLNGFDAKYFNSGFIKTSGIDYGAQWKLELQGAGDLMLYARASNLRKYDQKQPDGSVTQFAGTWNTNSISTAFPEWKAMGGITLDMPEGFSLGWTLRYIQGTVRDGAALPNVYYQDIVASYEWDDMNLVVGIDNLFDKDPPFAADETGQNAVSNQYDFVGRYLYVKAGVKY